MNPMLPLISLLLLTACANSQTPAPSPTPAPATVREQVAPTVPMHRAGRAAFPLPKGWTEARRDGAVVIVNPGFRPEDELAAIVLVVAGELAEAERERTLSALLREQLPQLAEQMASQEIAIDQRRAKVATLDLPGGPAAELRAPGMAGEHPVEVWIGARRDDTWSGCVIAIVMREHKARFLPGARAILDGMRFTDAEAAADGDDGQGADDPAAETPAGAADLAGAQFGRESFGSGASLTSVYTFGRNGTLQRRTMFSSEWNSSDSTTPGTFRCDGERVTLRVGDDVLNGTIERQGGRAVAIVIGGNRYRRL